nr:MAG TPA: hypothetical protein [Caudoviricetes sp.]
MINMTTGAVSCPGPLQRPVEPKSSTSRMLRTGYGARTEVDPVLFRAYTYL